MNTRVLELLKNPKNIQSEDLHLLKEEINSFPYIQNIRALHLYGVHLFDKENYQKELSATAAYTTDKKILYHLINGKTQQIKTEKSVEENSVIEEKTEKISIEKTEEPKVSIVENLAPKHDYEAVSESLISPKPEIKNIFVNGERNRILFEGEENFLEEVNNETIDLESTLESGIIVTQKPISSQGEDISEKEEIKFENQTDFVAAPSETIINEDKIDSEKVEEKVNNESEISFQKIEAFTPQTEVDEEKPVENATVLEFGKTEEISENLNIETVISEDNINSDKIEEKINDDSELSFIKIESFKPETEILEEENTIESSESEVVSEVLNTETIIEEDKIDSENVAEKINNDAELSFHGTDSFLPEIKIEANTSEQKAVAEIPKTNINKHEDEMRRLIEEVEKKMKTQKKVAEEKPEIQDEVNREISFAETQEFHVGEEQKAAEETVVKIAESIVEEQLEKGNSDKKVKDEKEEMNSAWKPMSLESHPLDSFSRKIEVKSEEVLKTKDAKDTSEENVLEEKNSEIVDEAENIEENLETEETSTEKNNVPVMNVSFFGNDISSLPIKKQEEKEQPVEKIQKPILSTESKILDDSNVPGFINTWQSWLKIDRTEEVEKIKTENKNKVIESFIENNPKISQLKDEVSFVVKEKTDDISHLMTETLANLYIEQKLYTKAINAFQVLVKKHPERKEYFENKIQEIKDNRGKN
ncbi:hypothetical protein [Chryseobacterium sp. GP-SGM7]|uniref:hypothetical protein n=1 Tax=Chryseobacterium sp. GP-SGM7 TaxID=3411323 RepID=UPI003B92D965